MRIAWFLCRVDVILTSSLFGECDSVPINCVASLAAISVSPKEVTTQSVNVLANLLGENRGLHGV